MGTLDILLQLFPNLKKNEIHSKEAQSLYRLWSNSSCQVSEKVFTRPLDVTMDSVYNMQKSGLVQCDGNKICITKSGTDLLNKMILDDDDFSIDYTRK